METKYAKTKTAGKKCATTIVLVFLAFFVSSSIAATCYIPHNGIVDHADENTPYSIAWYFKNYGSDHLYVLTSDMRYYIGSPLSVPENARLTDNGGATSIRAGGSNWDDTDAMIFVGNGATVENITIDANRIAAICLDAQAKNWTTINNCWVINTKNNYTTGWHNVHLIEISSSTNATIVNCTLKNAGCNPIVNEGDWDSVARGISAERVVNLYVGGCVVDQTMGASIAIARGERVLIENCTLSNSARCNLFNNRAYSEDSIIGYHNYDRHLCNATIRNNAIASYNNHGIHVSGERLILEGNTIQGGYANAIRISDWRTTPWREFSVDTWVQGNTLGLGSAPANRTYIDYYQSGTMSMGTNHTYETGAAFVPGLGTSTTNIYSFYDTFNDGDSNGWTANTGAWSVSDNVLKQSFTTGTRHIVLDNTTVADGTIQVYLHKAANSSGWLGVQFRKSAPGDSPYDSGYLAFVYPDGEVVLYKAGQGVLQSAQSEFSPEDTLFLRLTVELAGSNIKVYLDGKLMIDQNDSTYSSGHIGLACLGSVAYFDSVGIKN